MAIIIKTEHEIELMRKAGEILAKTHEELKKIIKPGISTYEIDKCGEDFIRSCGCEPSFLNYQGYPASICVSVNDEVVHAYIFRIVDDIITDLLDCFILCRVNLITTRVKLVLRL